MKCTKKNTRSNSHIYLNLGMGVYTCLVWSVPYIYVMHIYINIRRRRSTQLPKPRWPQLPPQKPRLVGAHAIVQEASNCGSIALSILTHQLERSQKYRHRNCKNQIWKKTSQTINNLDKHSWNIAPRLWILLVKVFTSYKLLQCGMRHHLISCG